jgi:hypothetical protein
MKALFAVLLLILSTSVAQAKNDAFATVEQIAELDAKGKWKSVKESTQAQVVRGDDVVLLTKGMELAQGETLRAMLSMTDIKLASGNKIRLDPGAEIVLSEPSYIRQLVGEVLYKVKGAFSVDYGTIHCTVEGTLFEVVGPNPTTTLQAEGDHPRDIPEDAAPGTISVQVIKGKVRVSTPAGEELLTKGTRILISADGSLGEVTKWVECALCGYSHTPH